MLRVPPAESRDTQIAAPSDSHDPNGQTRDVGETSRVMGNIASHKPLAASGVQIIGNYFHHVILVSSFPKQ